MKRVGYPGLAALALGLAACASSPPLHYYTLLPPAAAEAAAPAAAAPFQFELLPVSVPAQVDQPQLVVRQGGQGVAVLQNERWAAPLADEVHGALSAGLSQALGAQNVSGLPFGDRPVLRIKVELRRFESVPGSRALIDAAWSLRFLKTGGTLACTSRIDEPAGDGYDSLVQGHQRAIAALAAKIASVAAPLAAGQHPACPAG